MELQPPIILTTNYDRLVENAYAAHYRQAPTVLTYDSASTLQRSMQAGHLSNRPPIIFKLHGSIQDPGGVILSERDYRNLIYRQPGYRMVLSALFLTRVILMIGFSVEDPELLLLLENHREALKYDTSPDYAFVPVRKRDSVRVRRLRDDFGVHVIPYTASAGHPEILTLLKYLVEQANG